MWKNAAAWGGTVVLALAGAILLLRPARARVSCGPGFRATPARCMPDGCPAPLTSSDAGCVAVGRVAVPKATLAVAPSDWEAEGKVTPRVVSTGPFWIDAFEVTVGDLGRAADADRLRAASGISRDEAGAFCRSRGGRLPTEDEWMVAAAGPQAHRYPWGDTGAVCRRAAFGLASGPCSNEGNSPDTVGAHVDGDGAGGIHDLAGNVAEWVAPADGAPRRGVAKGGSWRSELASELRVWSEIEIDPAERDDRVGVRCAYDAP